MRSILVAGTRDGHHSGPELSARARASGHSGIHRARQPASPTRTGTLIIPVTLLLTCVTDRFVVQASDRLLTHTDGSVAEEKANKATMLGNHATFAYTGLSRCSVAENTDALLARCFSRYDKSFDRQLAYLAKEAARSIRNLSLPGVPPSERRVVRRTSFVGGGYLGIKKFRVNKMPSLNDLHPFLAVVSNAQGVTEEWRSQADQEFSAVIKFLEHDELFLLHAAGQLFEGPERVRLERTIRRSLERITHPESIARLLTRAIRGVADRNALVGPNVMCTMVRRSQALTAPGTFQSGAIPATPCRPEADYFRWLPDSEGPPGQWIYCPADREEFIYNTPNYAYPGAAYGLRFEPKSPPG
jgi:hypothetical protein